MKLLTPLLILFFILSCDRDISSDLALSGFKRSETYSKQVQEELMPNELFKALVDQEPEDTLTQIIDQNAEYLLETNTEGDTPLGLAIKFNYLNLSLFLAKQMSAKYYQHQNHQGESYLYLASQKGFTELVQFLSNQFYQQQQGLFIDYEFSDLDLKTKKGERAIHVAKNSAVVNILLEEYNRGFLEFPLRKFTYLQNEEGQTFLHTAVRDQNEDLLRWGLEESCYKSENAISYIWQGIQGLGSYISMDLDNLFNTQDHHQLTALNLAAKNHYLEGIYILSSCPWSHYLLTDEKGNNPLQNFLLSLDPSKTDHSPELKVVFSRLMFKKTLIKLNSVSKNINSVNNNGESSLHISARLNDSFFYKSLKKYGHAELKNKEGKSPREIFKAHQALLIQSQ